MRQLYEQFVRERKYLKNVTPKTEAWYWQAWEALGVDMPDEAAPLPGKGYWTSRVAELRDRGISAVTVNTYVRFSFHTMRHRMAVNYIRNGGDVFRLQRILGHATLEMTRRYVNLQTEDLKAVHDRLSLLTVGRSGAAGLGAH